jgi:hypothetical protein
MLLLLVFSVNVLADQPPTSQSILTEADLRGWYAGGGFAVTDGYDSPDTTDQSDSGYIINAGYRFTKFIAAEAGYLQDGNFSSAQLSGVFVAPLFDRWEAYAKIGWSLWEADTVPPGVKGDDDGFLAGVGLGVTVWTHWHFRLEYQAVNLRECGYFESCPGADPGTLDSFNAELHYRFGNGWK